MWIKQLGSSVIVAAALSLGLVGCGQQGGQPGGQSGQQDQQQDQTYSPDQQGQTGRVKARRVASSRVSPVNSRAKAALARASHRVRARKAGPLAARIRACEALGPAAITP